MQINNTFIKIFNYLDNIKFTGKIKKNEVKPMKIKEKDIYTKKGADNYVDDDIISSEEHGFMIGYLCAM